MGGGDIDGNISGVARIHQFAQGGPLAVTVDFVRECIGVAVDGVEAAVRIAAECEALRTFGGAFVVEDIDGSSARGKDCGRVSDCTIIPDFRSFVFNSFPRFKYTKFAVESQTVVR